MKRLLFMFKVLFLLWGAIIIYSCESSTFEENDLNISSSIQKELLFNRESQYIVVFGDIQEYTKNEKTILLFANSLNWIKEKQDTFKNILCVLHVGDVTWNNLKSQWNFFSKYAAPFSEYIPFITVIGNHDYTYNNNLIESRSSTLISKYADFPSLEEKIVARFDETIDNIIIQNTIGNKRYDIIALEFGPRKEVIEWTKKYVQDHPTIKYILLTHEWLTRDGDRIFSGSYAEKLLRNTTFSTPEYIWNTLVYPNDNIVCTLCGHNGFSKVLYSANIKGRGVPQILFNLQYFKNGGNGLVELWEFSPNRDYANIFIVDTKTNTIYYEENLLNSFMFKYKY